MRALPGLARSKVVFIPECNLGSEGDRLTADLCRAHAQNVYVMREDKKQCGIRMTNTLKKRMWSSFGNALIQRSVRWHPLMVTSNEEQTPKDNRQLVIDELRAYTRKLVYKKNDRYAQPTELYTGKAVGGCDDHAIAIQLVYEGRNIYEEKAAFYSKQRPICETNARSGPLAQMHGFLVPSRR